MTNDLTSITTKQWIQYFKSHGLPNELISIYTPYIDNLISKQCPVIFEFNHLSLLLEINPGDLASMINAPEAYYREFFIPKRCGKDKRKITTPYPSLLHCQRWIYKNILNNVELNVSAHGFVRGRSIITNASPHLGAKHLLKLDIKDFFSSISINWVMKIFLDLGYSNNVSYYLSSLCCLNNSLPQGGAASPCLRACRQIAA